MSKTTEPTAHDNANANATISKPVPLDTEIKRGDTAIASVQVRKPAAGELRGVSLADLAQLDVGALIKVLPRITVPTLLQNEVEKLEPCDLMALGAEVVGFLMSKADRASLSA